MINDTSLARAFWEKGRADDCPVYDMHGHMGPFSGIWFPRPSSEGMIQAMDRAGVRLLCFTPHDALFAPEVGNATSIEAVRKFPDRLRAYVAINPHYPEFVARDIAMFEKHTDVFVGVKLLSDYHTVPMTAAAYEPALKFADERKLLVLAHTWGASLFNGTDACRTVARRYPNIAFLLGHSLHGAWDDAIAVAREFPNVYLELCALLDNNRGVLEKFVEAGLSERMLFGTDLPWFAPHCGIGAILSADVTDEDRHRILHRNAQKLLSRFAGLT